MEISELKILMNIDYDDDDQKLMILYKAAEEYAEAAIGTLDKSKARVKILLAAITEELYNNGIMTVESATEKTRYIINSLVLQLQTEVVADGTTY